MRGLLASPLGLVVGFALGAFGSGGSIIAVPALVYAAGQSPQSATATSLLLVCIAALTGLPRHYREGRVRSGFGIVLGLTGIGGSLAGTDLNRRSDPDLLLLAFSGLIVVAAWRMLTACPTCTVAGEQQALAEARQAAQPWGRARRVALTLVIGTLVGFLTGLFGVGGGFVIVPALTLALGFNVPNAIGTSLLVVAINSAVALAARLGTVEVDVLVAAAFTLAAVIGTQVGTRVAGSLDPTKSLRAFAAGLVVLAIYTAARASAGLL